MYNIFKAKQCRQFILLLFFLVASIIHINGFADSLYSVRSGDSLGKIVAKNYPSNQRISTKQQIMVAILRANPTAFRGGNIHFLKKVDQLVLPTESSISLIPKDEAIKTIAEHYKFFKQKKTGNFPPIPLPRPIVKSEKKATEPNKQNKINKKEITPDNNKEIVEKINIATKEASDKEKSAEKITPNNKTIDITNKNKEEIADTTTNINKEESNKETVSNNNDETVDTENTNKEESNEEVASNNKDEIIDTESANKEKTDTETTSDNKNENSADKAENTKIENLNNNEENAENLAKNNSFPETKETVNREVTIYNWHNFLPNDVLQSFTETTGIKVNYFTYRKEDVVYEKVKALNGRGYDLLILSEELVQKIRDNGLLQAIDHRQLEHLDYLNPQLLNKSFDPNNEFSIPYLWASMGIAISGEQAENVNINRWEDLWDKKWEDKLLLYNSMRNLFAIALKVNGHPINSKNTDEIKQAYQKLRKLIPNIKKLNEFLEQENRFLINTESIGMIKNSSALKIKKKLPSFQYIYPKEGAIFLMANLAIPSNASNIENAYAFINYLLQPEIAARCVKELNVATPNLEALKLLDDDRREDSTLFPDEDMLETAEFNAGVGRMKEVYQLYWKKFKQELKMRQLSKKTSLNIDNGN